MDELQQEQYEEQGVSFTKLLSVMFHRKITLICITLFGAVAGTLGIKLLYNPSKAIYTVNYKYNVKDLNGDGTYIDGSKFYYKDLLTKSTLDKVKAGDKEFKSIDVDKIIENDGISLVYNEPKDENSTGSYTLVAKQKYFSDIYEAKDFIYDLVTYPLELNKE